MDNNERKKILGLSIKNERLKQKITQDKLSEMIKIDPVTLCNIENGKSFPSLPTLCAIMEILKIEPNDLLKFISIEKQKKDYLDIEIAENLKLLTHNTKVHLNELIKRMLK